MLIFALIVNAKIQSSNQKKSEMKKLNYLLTAFIFILLLGCELPKDNDNQSTDQEVEANDYVIVKYKGDLSTRLRLLHSVDKKIDYQLTSDCNLGRWRGVVPVQRFGSTIVNLNNNDACYVTKVLSIIEDNYETTLILSGHKNVFGTSVMGDNKIQAYIKDCSFKAGKITKLRWFGSYGYLTDINNTKKCEVATAYNVLEMY